MLRQFAEDAKEVTFEQFALALHGKISNPVYNEAFADAFDLFDVGKKGELTKDDLINGMAKLGEKLTDAEAEEMLKVVSTKDNFVRVMTQGLALGAGAGAGSAASAAGASPAASPSAGYVHAWRPSSLQRIGISV